MASLVGFRFVPKPEEIIFLLKKKRLDPNFSVDTITEVDIYSYEPWELPSLSLIQSKELVWHFYCKPYYKYNKSKREHRKTKTGYWKSTGKGSQLKARKSGEVIGTKRILPFCSSKNPSTEWVMHEISVEYDSSYKGDFVICRIERKRNTKRGVSISDGDQSSPDLGSCSSIDDVTGIVFPDSVTLPDQPVVSYGDHVAENSISRLRNHVAENIGLDSDVLAGGHEISPGAEIPCAEPRLPAEFNPDHGGNELSNACASFSALPAAPFHPEPEPSYSNGSSYGCDILNTLADSEINSQSASHSQNESSHGERGQPFTPDSNSSKSDESSREATFSPDFNPSKADGGVYVGNSSDMNHDEFCEWFVGVFDDRQIPSIV